jgi:hypothetical protein
MSQCLICANGFTPGLQYDEMTMHGLSELRRVLRVFCMMLLIVRASE